MGRVRLFLSILYNLKHILKFFVLKNKHKNKEAILIGNGPSVRVEDLKKIQESGKIIFVFNRFFLAYTQFEMDFFKPDYTVSIDPQVITDFGKDIIIHSKDSEVLLGGDGSLSVDGEHTRFYIKNTKPFKVSQYLPLQKVPTGDSVVVSAINIAYYMGIKNIYLYGVDHNFSYDDKTSDGKVTGGSNHFMKDYREDKAWYFPVVENIENAFLKCDEFLKKKGGFIKNCSRTTKLEVIKKKEFEECIQ